MENYRYVPIKGSRNPREGKLAIEIAVDLSGGDLEKITIPKGLGITNLTQVRSLYVHNPNTAANVRIVVASSGQVIRVNAKRSTYVPLFSGFPCDLYVSADGPANERIQLLITNYDLEAFKPSEGLSSVELTDGATLVHVGDIANVVRKTDSSAVLSDGATIAHLADLAGVVHTTDSSAVLTDGATIAHSADIKVASVHRNSLSNRNATIAATTMHTPTTSGLFRLTVFAYVTTAGTAGTVQPVLTYQTGVGTSSPNVTAALNLNGLNNSVQGTYVFKGVANQPIQIAFTQAGATGAPVWAAEYCLERLN